MRSTSILFASLVFAGTLMVDLGWTTSAAGDTEGRDGIDHRSTVTNATHAAASRTGHRARLQIAPLRAARDGVLHHG